MISPQADFAFTIRTEKKENLADEKQARVCAPH
jgi:hypothetical protein